MHHTLKTAMLRARGHRVATVSGDALLPDGTKLHLANAPLVTDKHTGAKSVRWGNDVWPVLTDDPLTLGHCGADL